MAISFGAVYTMTMLVEWKLRRAAVSGLPLMKLSRTINANPWFNIIIIYTGMEILPIFLYSYIGKRFAYNIGNIGKKMP